MLERALSDGRGVLLCSTHIPLFDVVLRALADAEMLPDVVVAGEQNLSAGLYAIPGTAATIPAIPAGANALHRLRTKLRAGGLVASLLDDRLAGPLSGNVLRLAGKLSAKVLFWSVKLRADGVIDIAIEPAPYLVCDNEDAVAANLALAARHRERWLTLLDASMR